MKLKPAVAPLLIVTVALSIFYWLQQTAPTADSQIPAPVPVTVTTMTVELGTTPLRVRSQGTVRPRTETLLTAQVAGEVTWVSSALKSGGRFHQGELLLRIDPTDHRLALQRAEADLQRAKAEFLLADSERQRIDSLHQRALVSLSELQQAKRNVDVAQANRALAASAVAQAKLAVERTQILAPYTGRVRTTQTDVGQFVQRGQQLAALYATDKVEVRLPLPDSQLAFLDPQLLRAGVLPPDNQPEVQLQARLGGAAHEWRGHIVRTEGEIDLTSRMVHVVAEVDNTASGIEQPLPVGLFVTAYIEGITVTNVVEIPRSAIMPGNTVVLVDDNNRLQFQEITLLRLDGETALISAGLLEGDRLCLTRLQAPVAGMTVSPTERSAGALGITPSGTNGNNQRHSRDKQGI